MMHPVESPQKRHFVVEEMPDIKDEIHEGDREKDLEPHWSLNQIEYTQSVSMCIARRAHNRSRKDQVNHNAVKQSESEIVYPSFYFRYRTGPIGNQKLQYQEKNDASPEQV
jgi:hypothetical protein